MLTQAANDPSTPCTRIVSLRTKSERPAPKRLCDPVVAVRDEVQRQRESDKNWPSHAPEVLLATRLRAPSEARRKHAEGDPDAVHAMRQSLVDIAAAASRAADDLPPPPPLDS